MTWWATTFVDCDFNLTLTPYRSDILRAKEDLLKFEKMDLKRLYLGHFGIADNPAVVYTSALAGIQRQLDIGAWCLARWQTARHRDEGPGAANIPRPRNCGREARSFLSIRRPNSSHIMQRISQSIT